MYRILWVSAYALHDSSSGAAIQCRTMLEYLKRIYGQQVDIKALCSLFFDDPHGAGYFPQLRELNAKPQVPHQFRENGIEYIYAKCHTTVLREFTDAEMRAAFGVYNNVLRQFRPDLIIGYGGDMFTTVVRYDAAARGIPVVYCVCNGNHKYYSFSSCAAVITDSQATAEYYRTNFGVNVLPVGTFIDPEQVVSAPETRTREFVTMVNPAPYKGLGIFARLALMAQKQLPEVKFLVVETRGTFAQHIEQLHEPGPGGEKRHVLKPQMFPNVEIQAHTRTISTVYAETRLLLAPSLWFECWGRAASEAVLNGIPVLASKSGGLPEAAGERCGAAVCLDTPQECQRDHQLLPSEAQVQPWMDQLKVMLEGDYANQCAEAARQFDPQRSASRVWEVLEPLLMRAAGSDSQLLRSGWSTR